MELRQPLTVEFMVLAGKHTGDEVYKGQVIKMAPTIAEVHTNVTPEKLNNLKMSLFDGAGSVITTDLYAKVTEILSESPPVFVVNFTSVPPEAEAFFEKVLVQQTEE